MNLDDMSELLGNGDVAIKVLPKAPKLVNRTASRHGCSTNTNGVYKIKQESPRQRLVVELAALGKTNKQIAEITGYCPMTVGALLRQPITQQVLVDEIRARADKIDEEVLQVVKQGCLDGVNRLLKIVRDDKAKGSDHIAAANTFLERRYGKANQPINAGNSVDLNGLSDAELATKLAPTDATGTSGGQTSGANSNTGTDASVGTEGRNPILGV